MMTIVLGFSLNTENLVDGISVSITGMLIVFTTLVLISIFIAALPRCLNALAGILPAETESHAVSADVGIVRADDDAIIAAIGYALHSRRVGSRTNG